MGAQAKTLPGKIVKIVLLCAIIWLVLQWLQGAIDFLYVQTDQQPPWWEIHRAKWFKYPLFAIVIYLVFNEKI